jgi:hypothetical protein
VGRRADGRRARDVGQGCAGGAQERAAAGGSPSRVRDGDGGDQ